ncbi:MULTISPECIES: L-fucose:H+ symporter permease [unclassified Anaerobiospirillum]|uniref:L-fucose:H+ symporter permease n=1 Tax=unclassified Anaerobiospirillum TaxID=2647410 RepID=UPI001FF211DA|nr:MULTISPECIES: L-fucose:H+ symporter permease [unclassified Anaerobiospirillum]MCK0525277.1 L-fucose:H+ symporter permease [Anaerobiospirillum sp. NML120449]MCK0536043.1 L-fucose:H+ symporter permease [Anaerobiospirillum sp. NML120511]MCK0541228.1 L-fucose:H+ symporter permease [Anaerobiospirillum sp. NML02-A-032]
MESAAKMDLNPASKPNDDVVPADKKVIFFMLVSCFVLWGLLNNITDNLVPAFGKIFMMSAVDSSLVQIAFYGAYACLAIPAALIIKKYSFRHGVLIGLGFYIIGALGYIPAAIFQVYDIFLVSIFILAGGLSVLETTCNPYVIALGSEETAIRRINFAQAFNPVGSIMGLFLAKFVILAHLNPATYEERLEMSASELSSIRVGELFWVCVPYVGLIAIALVIWAFFFRQKSDLKDSGNDINFMGSLSNLMSNKRYVFGVISQFFYVGMQIAVWTWMIKYIMALTDMVEHEAVDFYIYAVFMFVGARWVCTWLMKYIHAPRLMAAVAAAGMAVTLGTIYLPSGVSIICLMLISACMSLMFPTIYGIALRGLGDDVKLGAAGLIMAIIGGAVITPIMGSFIDNSTLAFMVPGFSGEEAAVRSSYFTAFVCMAVIFVYALFNSKKS